MWFERKELFFGKKLSHLTSSKDTVQLKVISYIACRYCKYLCLFFADVRKVGLCSKHPRGKTHRSQKWEIVRFPAQAASYHLTGLQTVTSLRFVSAWRRWYIWPVVLGNVGDNSVSSYGLQFFLHASETQQLSYFADATSICYLCVLSC